MPLYRAELIRRKKPLIGPQLHDVSKVLYLPFDLDDGSYARDRSGYSNHGTIYGATRVAGKIGGALSFDGVDAYVEVADSPSLRFGSGDFTVAGWFKWLGGGSDFQLILGCKERHSLFLFEKAKSVIRFVFVNEAGVWYESPTTFPVVSGTWYHGAFVRDGDKFVAYINGSAVIAPYSISGAIYQDTEGFKIGTNHEKDRYDNVVRDEVRIYNRALSQSEIKRLMNLRGV